MNRPVNQDLFRAKAARVNVHLRKAKVVVKSFDYEDPPSPSYGAAGEDEGGGMEAEKGLPALFSQATMCLFA